MPRALPWLAGSARTHETKPRLAAPPPKRKREPTPPPTTDLVDEDLNVIGEATPPPPKRRPRTPSTSPPPGPPAVEFMLDGPHADDRWRMVEDEFHATAQAFTQHIHHGEYVRLKRLAAGRGAATLRALARPTDGITALGGAAKMRRQADANAQRTEARLKTLAGRGDGESDDDDDDDDDYMMDPQLAGLMTRSGRSRPDLTGFAELQSTSKATAGFAQSQREAGRAKSWGSYEVGPGKNGDEDNEVKRDDDGDVDAESDDEDDDLDVIPFKSSKAKIRALPVQARTTDGHGEAHSMSYDKHRAASTSGLESFAEISKANQRETVSIERQAGLPSHPPGRTVTRIRTTNDGECSSKRPEKSLDNYPTHVTRDSKVAHTTGVLESSLSVDAAGLTSRRAQQATTSTILAKRRAQERKRENDEKRKGNYANEIPTFLI